MKKLFLIALLILLPQVASATTVYLTSGTTWTVPSDWNSSANAIEVIGGGANGSSGTGSITTPPGGSGGGGGAYSKSSNVSLAPSTSVTYAVGMTGTNGGDTYFCNSTSNCLNISGTAVQIGAKGASGSAGGAAASGVGTTKYSGGGGGNGGTGQPFAGPDMGGGGGGGGGAGGLHGGGNNGTAGASSGFPASGGNGGTGDAGNTAANSNGTQFGGSYGSGGGGNGGAGDTSTGASGTTAGLYGAGGGGGGGASTGGSGGAGKQGIIVITYTAALQCNGTPEIYSTPGTYTRSVPTYSSMVVEAWGGGGGGGDDVHSNGTAGGNSTFGTLTAGGGGGGASGQSSSWPTPSGGAGGSASGGDINTSGATGGTAGYGFSGSGGSAPNGGSGGAGGTSSTGASGSIPGGGGAGSYSHSPGGGGGGSGAYTKKTYASGALVVGSSVSLTVGAGGAGGTEYGSSGGSGASGEIKFTCSQVAAPTCTISLAPTTVAYGSSSTLTWSSTNADTSFYINNVGYVTSSGSTSVQPSVSTDYSGTVIGSGGTATCTAAGTSPAGTLTVTPPSTPAATITASSSSIYVGQSTGLHATFTAGSGDTLTHDNIDQPAGTGLGATTNPDAHKYITFTPSSPGTYTFYARAQTSYFTSWTSYASTTVTVTTPPSCTPAYTCSGQTIQYTNNICEVSNVTTCVDPAFCSAGSSSCLYPPPSFNQGNGFTGHLQAVPTLVPKNLTTKLYWDVSNVSSCSVSGNNGDHWTGAASGASGKTSASLVQQTVFTLSCTGDDDSAINESVTVNILPVFQEK